MKQHAVLSDRIAETLAEEIICGVLRPGERLAQDRIAHRFGCSQVLAREALQRVVTMELAVSEPRRGVRVVTLTPQDYQEILEMRLALEPFALGLAVKQVTASHLAEIERLREACDSAGDAIAWEKANRDFHLAILRPCGRARLLRCVATLQRLSAGQFHAKWHRSWSRRADLDHAAIVQAMRNRDGAAASACLKRHLSRG